MSNLHVVFDTDCPEELFENLKELKNHVKLKYSSVTRDKYPHSIESNNLCNYCKGCNPNVKTEWKQCSGFNGRNLVHN
jgi:hypothetical protein